MSKDRRFQKGNIKTLKKQNKHFKGKGVCPDGTGGFFKEHSVAEDGYCEICGYYFR